jgi:hypothetical protein
VRASETTFRQTPKNARPTWALASGRMQSRYVRGRRARSNHARGTRTPALLPPTSSCQAGASHHRPASGFCEHWRASATPWACSCCNTRDLSRAACCCDRRPQWRGSGVGSLTRCFATPDPRATDLAEPILAACVLLPLSPSLYAHDSTLRFCVCKVISGLSLSCQSVCLSSAVAHSAGLIRPGGFAVSTVAATPLH